MTLDGCSHSGARHGRFSINPPACECCGQRWRLSGCLESGPRLAAMLSGAAQFRFPCACEAEITVLVPPFVERSTATVVPAADPESSSPSRSRPAA